MKKTDPRHGRVALLCAGFVGLMIGVSYAAVPLYEAFCRITGFGGTTQVAEAAPGAVEGRTITVRFDANVAGGLPWDFKPTERAVEVAYGESRQISYRSANVSNRWTAGTATFNVTPVQAGVHFNKIQCFCFTEQPLQPGEAADMPVLFFVSPDALDDPNMANVSEITLSYTFFPDRDAVPPQADAAGSMTAPTSATPG